MAKEKEKPRDPSMVVLVEALRAANDYYSPGVESARLDAAEAILKHANAEEQWATDAALKFLGDAISGKLVNLGSLGKVRAARVVLAHARAPKAVAP